MPRKKGTAGAPTKRAIDRYEHKGKKRVNTLKDGYEVYFVSDCSAGCSREAHEDAKVRMTMAGARPMSWLAVQSEWTPDYTTPEKIATAEVLSHYGGASAMWVDYTAAQVKAGLVPPPAFMR